MWPVWWATDGKYTSPWLVTVGTVATSRRWTNVDADMDDVVGDGGTKALAVDDEDAARMAAARAAADRRVMM